VRPADPRNTVAVEQRSGGAVTLPAARPIEREYRLAVADNRRWNSFGVRAGDIFVCTPAKCGTTWMQTIVVTLLFPQGDAPGSVWELSPWLEARWDPIADVVAKLDAQTHRRCVKTHTPADGIPWVPEASYIVVGRDPRDVCMSHMNHIANRRLDVMAELATTAAAEGIEVSGAPPPVDDVHEFVAWWLDDAEWFHHVASFWPHHGERNVLFVHYGDLKADLESEMQRVAAFLGITVDDDRWPDLVARCTFEGMKQRTDEIGDFGALFVGGSDTFLYKGTNGRWRDVLTADEVAAFERRAQELLPADAIRWAMPDARA
jgi:aryl sulfotransferase